MKDQKYYSSQQVTRLSLDVMRDCVHLLLYNYFIPKLYWTDPIPKTG